jgi:osmoprotectant transport system substrate-binding protein
VAGAVTSEAGVAGAVTSEVGVAGVVTTEAGVAGAVTTEAGVAGAVTTEAGAATTAAPEGTIEAAVVASTEAGAATTAAPEGTIEAAVVATTEPGAATTEAAAATTEAAAATTEAALATEVATSAPSASSAPTESSAPVGSAPASSAPGSSVPAGEPGAITVGSADFPESQLLAQIYGQALAAAGFDVSYELGIGSREVYLGAIEDGEIDLVPEYTGSLLSFLTAPDVPETETVDDQLSALGDALPDGLEVLTPSTAEDKDTMVCTQEAVDEYGLTDLSSLFENAAEITLGAPPEFEERSPYGIAGFRDDHGAEFAEFVPLSFTDVQTGLESGDLDCGNLLSTGPWVGTEGLVIIDDDLNIIPHEAVLPLVRSDVVTPELTAALDEVNAALDTETLSELDAQVEGEQLGVDVVAADFLESLGEAAPEASAPGASAPETSAAETTAPETTAA